MTKEKPAEVLCFFCEERYTGKCFRLSGKDWPPPIPKEAAFAMCDECKKRPSRELAEVIGLYINELRLASN